MTALVERIHHAEHGWPAHMLIARYLFARERGGQRALDAYRIARGWRWRPTYGDASIDRRAIALAGRYRGPS